MAMALCAGMGQACMSGRCVGMQPPHRVVHCTLLGLPVAPSKSVWLIWACREGNGCSSCLIRLQTAGSVALDLSTDFVGDVQTEGTERPHQATSSQQPLGLSQAPSASCSALMTGATLGAAPHVQAQHRPDASCVLDDLVDGLADVRAVRAHNELHGHAPRRIDPEGQPHERLQRGLHVSGRPENSLFSVLLGGVTRCRGCTSYRVST